MRFPNALSVILTLPFALPTHAQTIDDGIVNQIAGCNFQTGWLNAACIPAYIGYIIAILYSTVGAFFLINVIVAGFQIAYGSLEGDRSAGYNRLRYSVIGAIITASSYMILTYIVSSLRL